MTSLQLAVLRELATNGRATVPDMAAVLRHSPSALWSVMTTLEKRRDVRRASLITGMQGAPLVVWRITARGRGQLVIEGMEEAG